MNKKTLFSIGSSFLLLVSLGTPLSVSAQNNNNYDGGGYGFGNNISNWHHNNNNSALQQSIVALGNQPVLNLTIPVLFGVELKNLTRNFGDPRAGHSHEGLDIMAPEGTPVVSPTNAVVVKVGFYSGAGNFVTTAAPGSESFSYMHLSKIADIKEGDVLKPGDLIGYVGHTGNAIATAPHLHFEVRDTNGVPSDPFPRLNLTVELNNKILYLKTILDKSTNPNELADMLATTFKSTFVSAKALGNTLPVQIEAALTKLPAPVVSTQVVSGTSSRTLKVGSRGPAVVALQTYLVSKNIGSAYKVKPDGSFGPITKQALIDFQKSASLGADGIYGPKSKAYVTAHP